jgi:hypothetical protein
MSSPVQALRVHPEGIDADDAIVEKSGESAARMRSSAV